MADEPELASTRFCPWCSAPAPTDATTCPGCSAALAQRETIGDLVIPGVTTVDPALQAYAVQPLRIPGTSRTQGVAGGTVVAAAAAGGPLGRLAALGGFAAIAASEYVWSGRGATGTPVDATDVGRPSESVIQALRRLDEEAAETPAPLAGVPSQCAVRDSSEGGAKGAVS